MRAGGITTEAGVFPWSHRSSSSHEWLVHAPLSMFDFTASSRQVVSRAISQSSLSSQSRSREGIDIDCAGKFKQAAAQDPIEKYFASHVRPNAC